MPKRKAIFVPRCNEARHPLTVGKARRIPSTSVALAPSSMSLFGQGVLTCPGASHMGARCQNRGPGRQKLDRVCYGTGGTGLRRSIWLCSLGFGEGRGPALIGAMGKAEARLPGGEVTGRETHRCGGPFSLTLCTTPLRVDSALGG